MSKTVGDEFVKYENDGFTKCYASPYLFTLRGQPTKYGPVDYDIFFAMNRVVRYHPDRTEAGLCRVVITAMDCDIGGAPPSGGGGVPNSVRNPIQ